MSRATALALVALALSGCVQRVALKPDQLAVLSDLPSPMQVGQAGHTRVIAVPTATVKTPEGLLVEIKSPYDAFVTTTGGAELEFNHPVRTTLTPRGFVVASANRPETPFDLQEVRAVEVTQADVPMSVLAGIGGSLVVTGILTLVVLSATHP